MSRTLTNATAPSSISVTQMQPTPRQGERRPKKPEKYLTDNLAVPSLRSAAFAFVER